MTTPPEITYKTPEPDVSHGSLPPPVAQPYPDRGSREVVKAEGIDSSRESRGFESRVNPPSSNMPETASLSMCWPAEDANSFSQALPTLPVMDNLFISQAFSGPEITSPSHSLASDAVAPPVAPSPWVTHGGNAGYHGYHQARTDGVPFWILLPEGSHHPAQPVGYGFDNAAAHYSNGYGPDTAMFRMPNVLGVASPPSLLYPVAAATLDHAPLHHAVKEADLGLARSLLERGFDVNCVVRGGITPIHCASWRRDVELVRLLMEHKANLNAATDRGQSVLSFAVGPSDMLPYPNQSHGGSHSHTDDATIAVIDALFDSPAGWTRLRQMLDQADKNGVTPLMLASEAGFTNTVVMFLQRGARPELRDHDGRTALRYAARGNHRHLVRLLLEADARVQAHDLSHLLKLASKNLTACDSANTLQRKGSSWWGNPDHSSSVIIAAEIVRLSRDMGILDGLLRLTEQKSKTGVLELLMAAARQLDAEDRSSQGATGS